MDDPDSDMMTVKYCELEEISVLLSGTSPKRYFFHLNISPLIFHFDELLGLIAENKLNFDFLGTSETRLKLNRNSLYPILCHVTILNISQLIPVILLYIKQGINDKLRKYLQIYKPKGLESTFVEVLEPGKPKNNMIIGCIYRHPLMELSEFNSHFI